MNWDVMSRAERHAAYNNVAAVTESATPNAAREAGSMAFRAAHPGHLDLRYGPRERNTWDLFPAADTDAPCLVFLHASNGSAPAKDQFSALIAGPAERGWAAALPGYTLAPDASLTGIVAEIDAVLDGLAAHGPEYGINGKVVLSGWSAGGHRTALCLGHPRIAAGLAISGVHELGSIRDTWLNEKRRLSDAGDRRAVTAVPAAGAEVAGDHVWGGGAAPAGGRQPRPARAAVRGTSAGGADPGARGGPFHHAARTGGRRRKADAAVAAAGVGGAQAPYRI